MAEINQSALFLNQVTNLINRNLWPIYIPIPGLDFGYVAGGNIAPNTNVTERFEFANDTVNSIIRGNLVIASAQFDGVRNDSFGWFAGRSAPTGIINLIDRLDFANDTANALDRSDLAREKNLPACNYSTSYGYWSGGQSPSISPLPTTGNYVRDIQRLDFAADTTNALVRSNLTEFKLGHSGTQSETHGYWMGGKLNPGTLLNVIDRTDFATDTVNALDRSDLTQSKERLASTSNTIYMWHCGGINPGIGNISRIERTTFATDTVNSISRSNTFTSSLNKQGSHSDNENFGWWSGGEVSPARVNIIQRTDFANDTVNTSDRADLTTNKDNHASI